MVKKQIIIIEIILVLITIGLTGCFDNIRDDNDDNNDNGKTCDSRFIGEWEYQNSGSFYIFKSNGSVYSNSELSNMYMGTWYVSGNQLCIIPKGQFEDCKRFEFSNNNQKLTFYNEDDSVLMILYKDSNNSNNNPPVPPSSAFVAEVVGNNLKITYATGDENLAENNTNGVIVYIDTGYYVELSTYGTDLDGDGYWDPGDFINVPLSGLSTNPCPVIVVVSGTIALDTQIDI